MKDKSDNQKAGRGRPTTRQIKLDATPERVARAIFAAAKKPDPMRRNKLQLGMKEQEAVSGG